MTINIHQRTWLRAFRQDNQRLAQNVGNFLRNEFGWEVDISGDYGCIYRIENNNGIWEEDYYDVEEMSDSELFDNIVSALAISPNRLHKIDTHFIKKNAGFGEYTKLPLPKDIVKEKSHVNT